MIDCSKPCLAQRAGAFTKSFVACNPSWLFQLTAEVQHQLGRFPTELWGDNGEPFMQTCFSETAFVYIVVEATKPD